MSIGSYFGAYNMDTRGYIQLETRPSSRPGVIIGRRVDTRDLVIFLENSMISVTPSGWRLTHRDTSRFKTDHIAAIAFMKGGCNGC